MINNQEKNLDVAINLQLAIQQSSMGYRSQSVIQLELLLRIITQQQHQF